MAQVLVRVFGVPLGACSPEKTWEAAVELLRRRLDSAFGGQAAVEYVELFTPRSFEFPAVLEGLKEGRLQVPIVLVDGQIVPTGGKLPISRVERTVRDRLEGRSS